MRGGSEERLVIHTGERRRHKPIGGAAARVRRWLTIALGTLAAGGGSALLFLVPLYADPALSALAADFSPEPAECVTARRDERAGLDNCTWWSCREGCTSDAYRCTQVHVRYRASGGPWQPAILLVNIKGCGYPPVVDCANFTSIYGAVGTRYPCRYSRADKTIAVPTFSRAEQVSLISRTLALPLGIAATAGVALCILHCECRPRRRRRRRPPLPLPPD